MILKCSFGFLFGGKLINHISWQSKFSFLLNNNLGIHFLSIVMCHSRVILASRFPQKWWSQVVSYMKCLIMLWPFIGNSWRYGWTRTRRRRRAPCKLSVSLLQLFCCLLPGRLSLSRKICAQRKAGKSKQARHASPPFFTLPMVPCASSPVTRVLHSPLCETMRKTKRLRTGLAV